MGLTNGRQVDPKIWENQEYGVLPIFLYNEHTSLGAEIELHFFEPRYLRLLRIACEAQIHCFIYYNSREHPQMGTTAYICSINTSNETDVRGIITNRVKINQSWMDMEDRLWWCRFQVVNIKPISPILETGCSSVFKCDQKNPNISIPPILFLNHHIPTEDKACYLHYNAGGIIRMYSTLCTPTMKQAIIKAATDQSDPEYKSLRMLPAGTIWYLQPEHSQRGVDCDTLVKYVETASKELTGSTTRYDLISLLVKLEVSCVKKIRVPDVKAEIVFSDNPVVRYSYSAKVDFGITKGLFLPKNVSLTPAASKRIFQQISRKVNNDRLRLLNKGHVCSESPLDRLPTHIIHHIKSFLIYI